MPINTILALIKVGDRQRTVDEATKKHIAELAEDIKVNGLIHAITVDQDLNLVAGFCRLSAIKLLNESYYYAGDLVDKLFIPAAVTHKHDQQELFRIELMENLRRKNLSPVDEAKAIAALHETLMEENPTDWSKQDTASALEKLGREVSSNAASKSTMITEAMLVAEHSDNEDVAKAGSMKEAVKAARKIQEKNNRITLGANVVLTSDAYRVIAGDCTKLMPAMAGGFAGILVDPPYGINAQNFGDQTGNNSHDYDDSPEAALILCQHIFSSGYQLTKQDAHLYMFCSYSNFKVLADMASANEWIPFPTPLIWRKSIGHMPWPGFFQRHYECILFARKEASRKLARVRSDIFDFPAVKDKIHSAEKPVALLKELCSLSFLPGERILDPCCGSGSIFPAAKELNLMVTGIELDPEMSAIARHRISTGE